MGRIYARTVLVFFVSLIGGFFAVSLGSFGLMELAGTTEPNGGGAMDAAFVYAPVGAIVIAVLASLAYFGRARRKHLERIAAPPA